MVVVGSGRRGRFLTLLDFVWALMAGESGVREPVTLAGHPARALGRALVVNLTTGAGGAELTDAQKQRRPGGLNGVCCLLCAHYEQVRDSAPLDLLPSLPRRTR